MKRTLGLVLAAALAVVFGAYTFRPAYAQVPPPLPVQEREQGSTGSVVLSASSTDCSAANSCATLRVSGGNTYTVDLRFAGAATAQFEGSVNNGTNFQAVKALPLTGGPAVTSATATGQWQVNAAGLRQIRIRLSAFTSNVTVWINSSSGGFVPSSLVGPQEATPFANDAVTTVVQVKATQGVIFSLYAVNTTAATAYLQVFCKSSASVTLGTTVPDFFVRLPSTTVSATLNGGTANVPLSFPAGVCGLLADGATAGTGISVAGTTTATGATGAAVSVTAAFK